MLRNGRRRKNNLPVGERHSAGRTAGVAVGASTPSRLDDVEKDAGLLSRQMTKCPACGSPIVGDDLCMNCWDIC